MLTTKANCVFGHDGETEIRKKKGDILFLCQSLKNSDMKMGTKCQHCFWKVFNLITLIGLE